MSNTDIGTRIAFATGLPATFDAAGYAAMTWLAVNGLVSIGELGDEHESVTVPDLAAGRIRTLKGAAVGATIPIALRNLLAGEAAPGFNGVRSAARLNESVENSLRITDAAGNVEYVSGVFMSWKRSERTVSSYEGFSVNLTLNYPVVEVPVV